MRSTSGRSRRGSASTSRCFSRCSMRSVSARTASAASPPAKRSARSPYSTARPKTAVTRERNRASASKLSPTGTMVTGCPAAQLSSTMRAAPVRNGSSRPWAWLVPSGKRQIASPAASDAATAENISTLREVSTPGSIFR